jgi:hypothetical protein
MKRNTLGAPERLLALPALLTTVILSGCGGDDPMGPDAADVNGYLQALPAWEEFAPLAPDDEQATGPAVTDTQNLGGTDYRCTTTPYSLTRTPEQIVTLNPDAEILWPGVLLQGNGYLQGIGSLQELPIRQRAPLALSIDLLTDGTSRTVENPDLASVNQAIGELIQASVDRGHVSGSNIYFTQERMYSYSQSSLKMGISAKYSGVEASANLSANLSSERTTMTAYFVQRMFTVSTVLPQTPGEFFSDEFTPELLQEQVSLGRIGPENLPVFVSSVVYGRILMFSLTSTANSDSVAATVNVVLESGGASGGGNLSASQQAILSNSQINVVTVGGDAAHALSLIRSGNLSEFFASDSPLTAARPISYVVRNLADNTAARFSETTEYSLTDCVPEAVSATGAEYRIKMNQVTMDWPALYTPCDFVPAENPLACEIYYDFWAEDNLTTPTRSVQWVTSGGTSGFAEAISRGETFTLVNNDGSGSRWVTVRLHFDGRDAVHWKGEIWDWDLLNPDERIVSWDVTYQGGPIPTGNHVSTRMQGANAVKLHYSIQKMQDLFD